MPEYSIRPATEADLPELARMRIELRDFLGECDPDVWQISDSRADALADFYRDVLHTDTARIFVAADTDDSPVGMLMTRVLENPNIKPTRFGRIDDAWVEPEHRRQGLMRRLTRAAAEFCQEQEVEHVMLDWAIRNPDSEKCWTRLGFKPAVTIGNSLVSTVLDRTS